MSESEYKIFNNNNKLIVCFAGMALQFGGILPFEFLNYLSSIYTDCNLLFYIDKNQCWYHKGIKDITNNIDDTVLYLNNIIKDGNYKKVIFMGISAGGSLRAAGQPALLMDWGTEGAPCNGSAAGDRRAAGSVSQLFATSGLGDAAGLCGGL